MEQNHSSRPLISVLIPVYNAGKYLAETLASIKNQTYSNLEIICIDDGSTDKSLAILQEFAQKDPRFKIISRANICKLAGCVEDKNLPKLAWWIR